MAAEDWLPPDYFYEDEPGRVTCKFCGAEDLAWEERKGQWVLVDERGRHRCRPKGLEAKTLDAFEAVN